MKTYYTNQDRSVLLAVDFTLYEVESFHKLDGGGTEEKEEAEAEIPRRMADVVVAPTVLKSGRVTKPSGKRESMTEEQKKEAKREYMRKWLAKKKGERDARKEGKTDLIIKAKDEIEEKGIPLHLVQEYGMTAVEVVLAEKNRGIGYTADEIFEMRDKRIRGLRLQDVEKIYDDLVSEGL